MNEETLVSEPENLEETQTDQVVELSINPKSIDIQEGESVKITIRNTALSYNYDFTNENIASFNKDTSEVTAVSPGKTIMVVSVGDVTADLSINVREYVEPEVVETSLYETSSYFEDVKLIEDGVDLVEAKDTNRPHKNIIQNVTKLANREDVKDLQSMGNWSQNISYKTGDIVSFLSNYYKSKKDDNLGNKPVPPTMITDEDEYWELIANSKNLQVRDFNLSKRLVGFDEDHSLFHPMTNGKHLRKFKLDADVSYTFLRMSRGFPFKSNYGIYLDFSENIKNDGSLESDPYFPKVSYIEFDVTYIGMKYNAGGHCLPEVNFKTCQCSNFMRNLTIPYPKYGENPDFDIYGMYGISIQANLRTDGLISLTLSTKWDCSISFVGDYNIPPFIDDEEMNNLYQVNHLVRPFGGDQIKHTLGELAVLTKSINIKERWDRGLIDITKPQILNSSIYSLFALATGYKLNYQDMNDYTNPDNYPNPTNNSQEYSAQINPLPDNSRIRIIGNSASGIVGESTTTFKVGTAANNALPSDYNTLTLLRVF